MDEYSPSTGIKELENNIKINSIVEELNMILDNIKKRKKELSLDSVNIKKMELTLSKISEDVKISKIKMNNLTKELKVKKNSNLELCVLVFNLNKQVLSLNKQILDLQNKMNKLDALNKKIEKLNHYVITFILTSIGLPLLYWLGKYMWKTKNLIS